MTTTFTSWLSRSARRAPAPRPVCRPRLDTLEDRLAPASHLTAGLPLGVDNLQVDGGQLTGDLTLAGQVVGELVADITTEPGEDDPTTRRHDESDCQILNLEIQPISLNLLGLQVDTSAICLDITADRGDGILGNLLCNLAAGDGPLDLGGILDVLNNAPGRINRLLDQLEGVLDNVLARSMPVVGVLGEAVGGGDPTELGEGDCDILNLALGPIDLNVLGLGVHLDDCEGGPVVVDIDGVEGQLLGDLLCGLADGLDLGDIDLDDLVGRIDDLVGDLIDLGGLLENLDDLPNRTQERIEGLLEDLEEAAGEVTSLADLDEFIDQVDRTTNRIERIIDRVTGEDLSDRLERLLDQLQRILALIERLRD